MKMKHYPKRYNDAVIPPTNVDLNRIGSSTGSVDGLIVDFRGFIRSSHLILFDMWVKQLWFSEKFLYSGRRRAHRQNGYRIEHTFSYFMKAMVGMNQKPITGSAAFSCVTSYFKDFFPNFSDHNPFEEPEYFKFPYKHITLDHLMMVSKCDERLEILAEADKRSMSNFDFLNWLANYISCYNDEQEEPVYGITDHNSSTQMVHIVKLKK